MKRDVAMTKKFVCICQYYSACKTIGYGPTFLAYSLFKCVTSGLHAYKAYKRQYQSLNSIHCLMHDLT